MSVNFCSLPVFFFEISVFPSHPKTSGYYLETGKDKATDYYMQIILILN